MAQHRAKRRATAVVVLSLMLAATLGTTTAEGGPRTTLSDGAIGKIQFETSTPASQRPLLTRSYLSDPKVVITAVVLLPVNGTLLREGKFPAVILAHGVGGVSAESE